MKFHHPLFPLKLFYQVFTGSLALIIGVLDIQGQPGPKVINAAELYLKAHENLKSLSAEDQKLIAEFRAKGDDPNSKFAQSDLERLSQTIEPTFQLISEASKAQNVDWPADWQNPWWMDSGTLGKQLARAIVFKANMAINHEKYESAAQAYLTGIIMSRHVGQDGVFMLQLIEASSYRIIINDFARNITRFPGEVLAGFTSKLDCAPANQSMKEVFIAERRYANQLIQQQGAPYPPELIKGFNEFYDQVVAWGDLPVREFEEKVNALGGSYQANTMVKALLPMLIRIRQQMAVHQTYTELFRLGLNVALSGPQAVEDSNDPFGEGAYEYIPLEGEAFAVRSQLKQKQKPVELTFGL